MLGKVKVKKNAKIFRAKIREKAIEKPPKKGAFHKEVIKNIFELIIKNVTFDGNDNKITNNQRYGINQHWGEDE